MKPPPFGAEDVSFSFVRGSGPGGQNVNKLSTTAQLRFDLVASRALHAAVKARLRLLAGHRLSADGSILIIARNQRTQEGNRREALERLHDLIGRALIEPKIRRPTRPTRASKARRLATKVRQQHTKRLRGRVRGDE